MKDKDAQLPDSSTVNPIGTFYSILETQTHSIQHLVHQYRNSGFSQSQLKKSLNILNSSLLKGGKIVISGVGKSHKIAAKIVATLNSLGLQSALLHPSEALHGDLGIIRKEAYDCLIFISSSGRSPELLQLLPYIPLEIPIVLLTNQKTSLLSQHFQIKSLLYAELPLQLSEEATYGLTAPTISTTLSLTLADAVSISLAELYISNLADRKRVFRDRHPGGAIGQTYLSKQSSTATSFIETPTFSSTSSLNSSTQNFSFSPALNPVSTEPLDPVNQTIKPIVFDLDFGDDYVEVDSSTLSVDQELLNKVKESNNVEYLPQFFKSESHIISSIALFDYIVINQTMVISTEVVKSIYRFVNEHKYENSEERLNELTWRIKGRLSRFQ
jgi:D-arabinose 5-phosphate isomerase GutQ